MRATMKLGLAAVALVLPVASALAAGKDLAVAATPPGITLQTITVPKAGGPAPLVDAYANADGMTLYTYDQDVTPNVSTCTGDCAKTFVPMAAAKDAKAGDKWSVLNRADGIKQWAYKGKPLYTYINDKGPGFYAGNKPRNRGGAAAQKTPQKDQPLAAGWQAALFNPADDFTFPAGISLEEIPNVFGQVLVDQRGMTLYAYDGDPKNDKQSCIAKTVSCGPHWVPVAAPQLSGPVGDFSIVTRRDGSKQWAYRGRALYTYSGDIVPGEAHGVGASKSWEVAMLVRYFTPQGVTAGHLINFGFSLTTDKGMTIYRRDSKGLVTSGHLVASNLSGVPTTGRVIGTRGCDSECLQTWKPLVAATNAKPTGYWEIMTGADGTRQWAYKGFALYTYTEDTEPGDVTGQSIYDIIISDGLQNSPYEPLVAGLQDLIPNYATSIFWTYAAP
jgi:predicted lipoprotein with Yx(FWY)xxD motif